MIFTASSSFYANPVLDVLDPNKNLISYRIFRENCIQLREGLLVKDLRILKGRRLEDIVIVDN